jgi:hypothetical protein
MKNRKDKMKHTNRLMFIPAFIILISLVSMGVGCNQYHTAVIIEHDFQVAITASQKIEINEFRAGNIPPDVHKNIENDFLKIAQGGEQVSKLMLANSSKQTVISEIEIIITSITDLVNQGTLGIKNPTTLQNFNLGLQTALAVLQNLKTTLGGA